MFPFPLTDGAQLHLVQQQIRSDVSCIYTAQTLDATVTNRLLAFKHFSKFFGILQQNKTNATWPWLEKEKLRLVNEIYFVFSIRYIYVLGIIGYR